MRYDSNFEGKGKCSTLVNLIKYIDMSRVQQRDRRGVLTHVGGEQDMENAVYCIPCAMNIQ